MATGEKHTYLRVKCVVISFVLGVFSPINVVVVKAAQVVNPPEDVTVGRGQTATLQCGVQGDVTVDPFKWIEYQTNVAGNDIYRNPPGEIISNPRKYQVEGQYNLKIFDVQLFDGGEFACSLFSQNSPSRANLVVLEKPNISVGTIIEGDKLPLNCNVQYGAPSSGLTPGQVPDIYMRVGDHTVISGVKTRTPPQPGSGTFTQLKMAANYTAQGVHNGQYLTCSVSTTTPVFSEMTSIELDVRFTVRDLRISPKNDVYYLGETINCTAFGNPKPSFRWEATLSSGSRQVSGNFLEITSDMMGDNTWKCRATNTVSKTEFVEEEISFIVMINPNPTEERVTESGVSNCRGVASAGVPVGAVAGIVVGLTALYLLITAAVCVLYRRRSLSKAAGSQPAVTPPTSAATDTDIGGIGNGQVVEEEAAYERVVRSALTYQNLNNEGQQMYAHLPTPDGEYEQL